MRDRISNSSEPRHRSDRPPLGRAQRAPWIGGAVAAAVIVTIAGVWKFREPGGHPPPLAREHGPLSVAILPFKDLSGTADSQIFTDGIAEMIRSRLGESRTVRVITGLRSRLARQSARRRPPARSGVRDDRRRAADRQRGSPQRLSHRRAQRRAGRWSDSEWNDQRRIRPAESRRRSDPHRHECAPREPRPLDPFRDLQSRGPECVRRSARPAAARAGREVDRPRDRHASESSPECPRFGADQYAACPGLDLQVTDEPAPGPHPTGHHLRRARCRDRRLIAGGPRPARSGAQRRGPLRGRGA